MIIDDTITLDLYLDEKEYLEITLYRFYELLEKYVLDFTPKPTEMIEIPNAVVNFSENNNYKFSCHIYKTTVGKDKWILLMQDDIEGYALYENPATHKLELAWYNTTLDNVLPEDEQEKIRTCYVPKNF